MGSTSKYHMKWKLVCVCKCGSRIFFSRGQLCLPGGSSPFFRYIYYVNLVLNFPGARGSGPLGIFKLFIRSAHGIYIYLYAPLCKMDLLKCYCLYIFWLVKKPSKISSYKDGWSKLYYIKYIHVYHLHQKFKFHQTKTYTSNKFDLMNFQWLKYTRRRIYPQNCHGIQTISQK